jgi:hypothetical protein
LIEVAIWAAEGSLSFVKNNSLIPIDDEEEEEKFFELFLDLLSIV